MSSCRSYRDLCLEFRDYLDWPGFREALEGVATIKHPGMQGAEVKKLRARVHSWEQDPEHSKWSSDE